MDIDHMKNKQEPFIPRKKRTLHKSKLSSSCLYSSYKISKVLRDSMILYKKEQAKPTYETIINDAFAELELIWTAEKKEPTKNKMIQCLRYNPPPNSKQKVPVSLRFDSCFSYLINDILNEREQLARDTTDLIERMLTWYLRNKGFLAKIE